MRADVRLRCTHELSTHTQLTLHRERRVKTKDTFIQHTWAYLKKKKRRKMKKKN